MNIFYDTEFMENGQTIDLISIGMVGEDGREYYAVSYEFDGFAVARDPWLMEHVMSSIGHYVHYQDGGGLTVIDDPASRRRDQIALEVAEFIRSYQNPELWAWYGAYDHVALAQLFGKMIHLPTGIPMYTNDLKTFAKLKGNPRLPDQAEGKHNALEDAKHNKVRFDYLTELPYKRYTGSQFVPL